MPLLVGISPIIMTPDPHFLAVLHTMTVDPSLHPSPPSIEHELAETIGQVLALANNHQQCGQFEQAGELYREILEIQPNHPDANHHLGMLALQAQRPAAALANFERALKARPEQAQYWLDYVDALIQAGQFGVAQEVLDLGQQYGLEGGAVETLAARLSADSPDARPADAIQKASAEASSFASPQSGTHSLPPTAPRPQKAIKKTGFHRSTEIMPRPEDINNVVTLYSQGRLAEVEALSRSLTACFPQHGFGWKVLGAVLQMLGRVDDALPFMQKAAALLPDEAEAHSNLGFALWALGRFAEAESSLRKALSLQPDYVEALSNLGIVLQGLGRLSEAETCLRRALELRPDFSKACNNLGQVLKDQGKLHEAEASYRRALELSPNLAEAHYNLGNILQDRGMFADAEASLRQALVLKPDFAKAHNNLGYLLKNRGLHIEAEACYRQALQCNPDYAEAHNNLGNILQELGRLTEAEANLRRAIGLNPNLANAHNNLGLVLQEQGRLSDAIKYYQQARDLQADSAFIHSNLLFCLSQIGGVEAKTLFAEHCRFGERFEAPLRSLWVEPRNSRDPDRCLQVGFVSGDLRTHAVANFIELVLAHLANHRQLSLHAYYNHTIEDSVTERFRRHLTHWHSVVGLTDAALAEKIRADGIDILIDLSGHTAHNRLLSFARKPAPVQASWMGYPGTTGLQAMDYYLTDRFFLPPGQFDDQFTEKIAYLPGSAPFLPSAEAPLVNVLPALTNGYITFGSFNRPSKLSHTVISLWSKLLRALPDARMLLAAMPEDGNNDTLLEWFANEGIAPGRLSFHPRSGMQGYLALHHQVDICLDTFPYAGGTTTFHALWMGVPTLTMAGPAVASRSGASILGRLGLDDFVAIDTDDFVQKGLLITGNVDALSKLRLTARERFKQSSIGRPEVIADGLANALRTMWQRWCLGQSAASFEVDLQNLRAGLDETVS